MSDICPLCHRNFDRPKGYDKYICPRCNEKVEAEKRAEEKRKEIEQDTRTYVVVFLSVSNPEELFRGFRKECIEVEKQIYKGTYGKFRYLEGSERLRVWLASSFDNPKGRIVIPTGSMDGISSEDFDPSSYD